MNGGSLVSVLRLTIFTRLSQYMVKEGKVREEKTAY